MQRAEEMAKRAYSKPKIVRVQLNPEQAVLSQCSIKAGTIFRGVPTYCVPSGPAECRQYDSAGIKAIDFAASS